MIADAFALAIVVFAVSISMAKILAKKNDYEVNANQVCTVEYLTSLVSCNFFRLLIAFANSLNPDQD